MGKRARDISRIKCLMKKRFYHVPLCREHSNVSFYIFMNVVDRPDKDQLVYGYVENVHHEYVQILFA